MDAATPFLSTPSARRATKELYLTGTSTDISIHALREEGDPSLVNSNLDLFLFLSTPSARRATVSTSFSERSPLFLSTPSARRATHGKNPCHSTERFLSTPSARRATVDQCDGEIYRIDFYPRPPRGGRHNCVMGYITIFTISIHALREEGDESGHPDQWDNGDFYPRPPRGGRPPFAFSDGPPVPISIHALREEGDGCTGIVKPMLSISIHALRKEGDATARPSYPRESHFYPRPPQGGRRIRYAPISVGKEFLSTPSARRATM